MRIYMQTLPRDESIAIRYYQIIIQPDLLGGWSVVREWGRQGASGRVQQDHFEEYAQAEQAASQMRDQQLKRGYKVVFSRGMTHDQS